MKKMEKLKKDFDLWVIENHIGFYPTKLPSGLNKDIEFYQIDGILYQIKITHDYIPQKFKKHLPELLKIKQ